jgi:hypothetical protein
MHPLPVHFLFKERRSGLLEDLKTLVELQNVDSQLFALEKAKGDLPQRVQELSGQIEQLSALRQEKAGALATAQRNRRSAEGELEMAKERKKKYENQIYSVKTNKEYDAVTAEIEATLLEIDRLETKILEAIEQEESLQKEVAEHNGQLAALQREYGEQQAILQAREAEASNLVQLLEGQREALVVNIPRPLLGAYQRILKGKDGLAVVPITRGACGGCLTRIPPQRMMEIREMNQIFYCESCGRILIWNHADEETVSKNENTGVSVGAS